MTRPCGCGGNAALNCNCSIVPGPNTTVTGTGDPEDPYVITAGTAALQVTDTNSVDLTLTGDGQVGTPYNVSAAVRVDPAASNLITVGASGLAVSCPAVQDCVGLAVGDGLAYDNANNVFSVRPSTDVGNIVLIGTDGGVYASSTGVVVPAQPRARLGKVAAQPIPTGAAITTLVAFDQVITDNAGLNTAVGRLTAPIAGGYAVGTTIQWQNTGANTGHRAVFLRLNGTTIIAGDQQNSIPAFSTIQNVETHINLAAGNFVEVVVQHSHSAALNLLVANNFVPTMWMYYATEGV